MIPPIKELLERLLTPNPEFEAWAHSLPPTHWVKRDISSARMGWEAHQATASGSPFKSFDSDGLDTHRLAEATDLIEEAYSHGDTESWGERAAKFLRATDSATVTPE